MIGQRIGPFAVVAKLGEGGMGEVYRATDTTLGRDVAIKVLPQGLIADPDRMVRFEREARMLASLNHPNIAAIHGVEASSGTRALVLELVDGLTLAERIAARPMPVAEALAIARQIADALEAAHEKGIVHRDLKPQNIKVAPGDRVKVLDFGLAIVALPPAIDSSHSPTMTAGATRDGALVGTIAYMSPEQLRALPVDRRADIWAFGCLLFEMLTGRHPFAAATGSDRIASILSTDPDWTAVPPQTPPAIRRLLRRCLEKDADRRLRDIADGRLELDERAEPAARRQRRRTPSVDINSRSPPFLSPQSAGPCGRTAHSRHRRRSARYGSSSSRPAAARWGAAGYFARRPDPCFCGDRCEG